MNLRKNVLINNTLHKHIHTRTHKASDGHQLNAPHQFADGGHHPDGDSFASANDAEDLFESSLHTAFAHKAEHETKRGPAVGAGLSVQCSTESRCIDVTMNL